MIFDSTCNLKNSWGTHKGDNGYFYLQRGVKMCGIGQKIVTLDCGEVGKTMSENHCSN